MRYLICNITALFLFLSVISIASAEIDDFKDAIWNKCEAARELAHKIQPPDRETAVAFLKGIIVLELGAGPDKQALNPEIIKGADFAGDVSIAQSLDFDRSNRAKKCSADLLPDLLPEALQAIPDLIMRSEDSRISSELGASFTKSAYDLAQKFSGEGNLNLPADLFDILFESYLGRKSTLSESILALYPDQLATKIAETLLNSTCVLDCSRESNAAQLLPRLYIRNPESKKLIIRALQDSRQDIQIIILRALQYYSAIYEELLVMILGIIANSAEPLRSQLFQNLNAIFNYELSNISLPVDPKTRLNLIPEFAKSNEAERDILEKGLSIIAPLYVEISSAVNPLINSPESDLRSRAARLLTRIIKQDNRIKKQLAALLSDPSVEVRLVTLEHSLSAMPVDQLLEAASKVHESIEKLRKEGKLSETELFEEMTYLLRIVILITGGELKDSWIKASMNTIEQGLLLKKDASELNTPISILQENSKKAARELKAFARSRDASKRAAAVFVMQRAPFSSPAVFDILLGLLADTDPRVAKEAQLALLSLSDNLRALLEIKRSLAPSPRYDELLLESGLRPDLQSQIQIQVEQASCTEVVETSAVCLPKPEMGPFCAAHLSQIRRCIESGILTILPPGSVTKAISLQPKIRELFIHTLMDERIVDAVKLEVGIHLLRARESSEQVINKMCELSKIAPDNIMSEIVSYVSLDPLSVKNCLRIFKNQFESADIKPEKRAALFAAIVQLDPSAINIPVMLNDALESGQLDFLRILMKGNLVADILPLLDQIIKDASAGGESRETILALQLSEEMGERAVSLYPAVSNLLNSASSEISYRAARAMIAINQDQALSKTALRSILSSPKLRELILDPPQSKLPALAETLLHDPSANLSSPEKRNLLRLLRAIKSPDAAMPEPLEAINPPMAPQW